MDKYLSEFRTRKERDPNDKAVGVSITTNSSMRNIDADQWNAMVDPDNPAVRHEFLLAFEESGCCCPESVSYTHLTLPTNREV